MILWIAPGNRKSLARIHSPRHNPVAAGPTIGPAGQDLFPVTRRQLQATLLAALSGEVSSHRPGHPVNALPILFDAGDVVAVNKPEGIASIRERRGEHPYVQNLLAEQLGCRIYVVHRLDKDVSGALLFARTAEAHRNLSLQFECREVEKAYLALVFGSMAQDRGMIDTPLREFGSGRVAVDRARGKPCLTEFRVIDRLGGWTILEVKPHTGRRHQIRAHLYSIGHPVAGDPFYGDDRSRGGIMRLMLHAERITFRVPNGEPITVQAPRPESFRRVMEAIA